MNSHPWSGSDGAEAFDAVVAATDWLLGYPFVFRELSRRIGPGQVLVDYGCGPGKVAGRAVGAVGARVIGVDASPQMLELARRTAPEVAEYHLVADGRVVALPDGCADAVMCNHVLPSLPTQEVVLEVFAEIRRLLRPGGALVLLTSDPACTGAEYASLRVTGGGAALGPGEELTVRLLLADGSWREVPNHAWPPAVLPGLLERAGFRDPQQHRPTVAEALPLADPVLAAAHDWAAERAAPPLVVTTAVRA